MTEQFLIPLVPFTHTGRAYEASEEDYRGILTLCPKGVHSAHTQMFRYARKYVFCFGSLLMASERSICQASLLACIDKWSRQGRGGGGEALWSLKE
jgi:hypothetical protein